jgi:hypothetical protein
LLPSLANPSRRETFVPGLGVSVLACISLGSLKVQIARVEVNIDDEDRGRLGRGRKKKTTVENGKEAGA